MAAGLAAQLAQVRTVIAALTPLTTTSGATAYTAIGGVDRIEHAPPISDRSFEVRPVGVPEITGEMAPDSAQFLGRFEVVVDYDALARHQAMDTRIAEDAAQIVGALEKPASYAANVQRVTGKGGSTEATGDDDYQFVRMTLQFECLFRQAI